MKWNNKDLQLWQHLILRVKLEILAKGGKIWRANWELYSVY